MTPRDRIGLAVLIGVLLVLFGFLVWSLWGRNQRTHGFADSPVVKQRIINVEKSK